MKGFITERQTLKKMVKNRAEDRIELEIGDSKQNDFFPQAKIMRWDNEVNFSIRRDNGARTFREKNGKIIAESAKEDIVIYEKPEIAEDGGLEIEIHLKKKPDTNIFEFTLQSKGLNFFYQPELTFEEVSTGEERPENIVGSYAVYHQTKRDNRTGGNHYKAGKAFHIYRPEAHDSGNNKVWCELSIENDILKIVIPQEFLDNASYPVIVDPTLGYTSLGASTNHMSLAQGFEDRSHTSGKVVSLGVETTLESIHLGTKCSDVNHTVDTYAAIWRRDSAGADSHDEVAHVEELNLAHSTTAEWKTFTAAGEALTADEYIIGGIGNGVEVSSGTGLVAIVHDTGVADSYYRESTTEAGGGYAARKAENPWTDSVESNTRIFSIYITYASVGTNCQLNIGDSWKAVDAMKINIGDVWKDVVSVKQNIGDSWKTVF